MPFYQTEPPYSHGQATRTGILLINLGTPEAPTAKALRPYLKEFLSDRRVVEIPRLIWWLILNGIILNTRPKKSAEKYASIWRPEGSPLKHFTARQADLLATEMARRSAQPIVVHYAMRYGQPSVDTQIQAMKAQGVDRILLLPLYPQYAASSTGSALDAAWLSLLHQRNPPEIRALKHFHADPAYINALKQNVQTYWVEHGQPDVLLMSFHGIPRRSLDLGDPYHCECHRTGRLLAEALSLKPEQYRISFQSRFGRAEWLKPYTTATLEELGHKKTRRVDVICPGFIADCLETLEEIALEGKADFLKAGGGEYHYIAALNDRPVWINALADIALAQMGGWVHPTYDAEMEKMALDQQCLLAKTMGAKNLLK